MQREKIRATCANRRPLSGMGDPNPHKLQSKDIGFRPSKQCAGSFPAGARSITCGKLSRVQYLQDIDWSTVVSGESRTAPRLLTLGTTVTRLGASWLGRKGEGRLIRPFFIATLIIFLSYSRFHAAIKTSAGIPKSRCNFRIIANDKGRRRFNTSYTRFARPNTGTKSCTVNSRCSIMNLIASTGSGGIMRKYFASYA